MYKRQWSQYLWHWTGSGVMRCVRLYRTALARRAAPHARLCRAGWGSASVGMPRWGARMWCDVRSGTEACRQLRMPCVRDVEAGAESLRRPEPPLEHLVEEAHEEGAAGGVDPFGHQIVRDGAQARHRCLRRGPGQSPRVCRGAKRARALPPPHSPAGEACREARPPRRCSEAVCRRAAPRGRRGTARPSGRGSAPQSRNRGAAPRPRLARSPPQRAGSGAAGCGRR